MLPLAVEHRLRAGFLVALVATLGSLYFSEVMKLPPCVLCWYQRICMYPLVLIFGTGLYFSDGAAIRYARLLAALGWSIALYHVLLYYRVIPDSIKPCSEGLSCTTRQIEWLGFITIPALSLFAFSILVVLLFWPRKGKEV